MKSNWRVFAEVLAVVSVLASLGMVWYELRLARSTGVGEFFSSSTARLQDIRFSIAEHASVWNLGCSGQNLTPEHQSVFLQLVAAVEHDLFINYLGTALNLSARAPESVLREMARNMYLFSGFNNAVREIWDMRRVGLGDREYGRAGWKAAVLAELATIQSIGVDIEVETRMCGI